MNPRYYVTKISDCPYCEGKGRHDCSCKDGKVESRVTFEEALDSSRMSKEFKSVMENLEKMMDITMQGVLANLSEAINPHKGKAGH